MSDSSLLKYLLKRTVFLERMGMERKEEGWRKKLGNIRNNRVKHLKTKLMFW